eukprot:gene9537-12845_t
MSNEKSILLKSSKDHQYHSIPTLNNDEAEIEMISMSDVELSKELGMNKSASFIQSRSDDEMKNKSIGWFGSFVLLSNNISGPAMMGLPHIFHQAGLIPSVICIILVCICSSLCSTFLAESIASIDGNHDYSRNIDFSHAFRIIVGKQWYVVAESLFLISCSVQACAGIVETAQSLDGFLASFLLHKTYGIQFLPKFQFISWSPTLCYSSANHPIQELDDDNSNQNGIIENCTPFHHAGPLVLTLGFIITTILFLPLARGQLKETIFIQIFSFIAFVVFFAQFSNEFISKGFNYSIPLYGEDISQLAGVILFNFAFSITVPSWLNEKKPIVSTNKLIWTSTIVMSSCYILFGTMATMSFQRVTQNFLVLLGSSQVHLVTRVCAALFCVTIIGCGIPVFCVIIKKTLTAANICDQNWALFWGAVCPYLLSWMLYQGSILLIVLNWTGLVVNGLVAFILPMFLALKTIELREEKKRKQKTNLINKSNSNQLNDVGLMTNNSINNSNASVDIVKSGTVLSYDSLTVHAPNPIEIDRNNDNNNNNNNRTSIDNNDIIITKKDDTEHSNNVSYISKQVLLFDVAPFSENDDNNSTDSIDINNSDNSSIISDDNALHLMNNSHLIDNHNNTNSTRRNKHIVKPLPIWLEKYRKAIIISIITFFAVIIIITIITNVLLGIIPGDLDEDENVDDYLK